MISSMQRSAADQTHVLHINIVVIVITVNRASNSHLLDDSPGKCLHDGIYGVGECTLEYSIEFRPLSTIYNKRHFSTTHTRILTAEQIDAFRIRYVQLYIHSSSGSNYGGSARSSDLLFIFFFYLLQARYVRIVLQYNTPSIPFIPFHPSS